MEAGGPHDEGGYSAMHKVHPWVGVLMSHSPFPHGAKILSECSPTI